MKDRRALFFALGLLAVLGISSTGPMALRNEGVQFPDGTLQTTAAAGARSYFLSSTLVFGGNAPVQCQIEAPGYHMASMFELLDLSNLRYATGLGRSRLDAGAGPSSLSIGWVRTGSESSDSLTPGQGNCWAWSTLAEGPYGTIAWLEDNWGKVAGASDSAKGYLGPWIAATTECSFEVSVWCISD